MHCVLSIAITVGDRGTSQGNADRGGAMSYVRMEAAQDSCVRGRHLRVASQLEPRAMHVISRKETISRETNARYRRATGRLPASRDIML